MKYLLALSFLLTGLAHGAEIKVFETPGHVFAKFIKGNFTINKYMGRAWVDVHVAESDQHYYNGQRSTLSTMVKGLYFDAATSKIMLEHEGQLIDCASVSQGRIYTNIRETGCKLVSRTEKRTIDDGFNTHKVTYLQVYLVTK